MTQGQSQVIVKKSKIKIGKLKLLNIQEFANVCRTTPRTLRFYEQKGLFKPYKIDLYNKYRLYHPRQAREFLKIRLLQNFHVPLRQISKKIKQNGAEKYLSEQLKRVKEEILEKEKEYKFLENTKRLLFDEKNLRKVFKQETFGPHKLFCMKVENGEYAKITDYIKILWKEAKKRKLQCEDSEITFYLKNTYNPKNTPMEISLILKNYKPSFNNSKKQSGIFYFKSYPKTKIMAYEYVGPYDYLILIYQKLYSYFENNNIKLKDKVFETYKYGPLNKESKYDYKMTIGFPV